MASTSTPKRSQILMRLFGSRRKARAVRTLIEIGRSFDRLASMSISWISVWHSSRLLKRVSSPRTRIPSASRFWQSHTAWSATKMRRSPRLTRPSRCSNPATRGRRNTNQCAKRSSSTWWASSGWKSSLNAEESRRTPEQRAANARAVRGRHSRHGFHLSSEFPKSERPDGQPTTDY